MESGETLVPEAEADQGVALVIVMLALPKTDRRRYITKRDLVKYGYTDECQACTQLASGMHNAKVPDDDRCRDRIGELMVEDDDQRQGERVPGTVHPEVEIPRPGAGEETDVGEPMVRADGPAEDPPVPTVRVGGSSSSGTRAGSGSRANEANTGDRKTKRVRFTESRGLKRQSEDVEELAANAEEQHLDADVGMGRCHKTWRGRRRCRRCGRRSARTASCRARQKCLRRSKSHSDHFVWLKISTMRRSWSCAYSRIS